MNAPLVSNDAPKVAAAQALNQAKMALATLVCPFKLGEKLTIAGGRNPSAPHLTLSPLGRELSSLAGVRRVDDRAAAWTDESVIVFHVDRIDFNHPLEGGPLSPQTVAQRWSLIGHIQDGRGHAKSGQALQALSAATLKDRMERMPPMPKVAEPVLGAALERYEFARRVWLQELEKLSKDQPESAVRPRLR